MTSDPSARTLPGYTKVYVGDADTLKPGLQSGLFARKDLRKGEVIFVARGTIVRLDIKSKRDSAKYPNAIGLRPGVWLNPEAKNPLTYLNHSCNPNAGIKGSVTFVARRPIKKGEHITIDYSITECDAKWTLDQNCKCGSSECRGVIKSIQSLPHVLYNTYMPYIPRALQRAYHNVHRST